MKRFILLIICSVFIFTVPFDAYTKSKSEECAKIIELAKKGEYEGVKRLTDDACDIDIRGQDGMTTLMHASYKGHLEIVKFLLKKGAKVNITDTGEEIGYTALMLASTQGKFAVVKELLKNGANTNIRIANGATPLFGAVEGGYSAIVKELLDKGADPNVQNSDGTTALVIAKKAGHEKIVALLKQFGAH